jgi:preprotein translocase subunit SecB
MKVGKPARFRFVGYSIDKALIEKRRPVVGETINISFAPSGEVDQGNKTFYLHLKIVINDDKKTLKVEVNTIAEFQFNMEIKPEDLEGYFYINAPAIVFPYIRAYISTLTNLAGWSPVVLPTLNLSSLKEDLKKNTIFK